MEKKALKRIIQNYKRNKKRIEEIKRDVYSLSGIDYTKPNAKEKQSHDHMAEMIYRFEKNAERRRAQKEVDAVDRMILRLSEKEKQIYTLYFDKGISWNGIENYGYSRGTIFNTINIIYIKLNEEIELF